MVRLFRGARALRSIQQWVSGRKRPPDWAIEMTLAAMEPRVRDGAEIVRDLRTELGRRRLGIRVPRRGGPIGLAMKARMERGERGRLLRGPP